MSHEISNIPISCTKCYIIGCVILPREIAMISKQNYDICLGRDRYLGIFFGNRVMWGQLTLKTNFVLILRPLRLWDQELSFWIQKKISKNFFSIYTGGSRHRSQTSFFLRVSDLVTSWGFSDFYSRSLKLFFRFSNFIVVL